MSKLSKMHQRVLASSQERKIDDALEPLKPILEAEIPANTIWDDLENVFQVSMQGILKSHSQLASLLSAYTENPAFMATLDDAKGQTLVLNINGVANDIQAHITQLNNIHGHHVGRTGGAQNGDEYAYAISLGGSYSEANEFFDITLAPTVADLFEQLGAAEALIAASQQQAEAAAQDPTVVTDAVVKEA